MSKNGLRAVWEERLVDYRSSDLTQTAWCGARGIPQNQLSYWKARLEAERSPDVAGKTDGWCPVNMVAESIRPGIGPVSAANLTLRLGQVSIEVPSGFDPELRRGVVRALNGIAEGTPC